MAIILDYQLREQIPHDVEKFPITYFCDELAALPNWAGPLHWHPDFEIATAVSGVLDFQVGQHHVILKAGDSILVNGNILHGIKQLSGDIPDPMPNIVFSGALIASETSDIYQKYIQPVANCDALPFIVFNQKNSWHNEVNQLVKNVYGLMSEQGQCYEMAVQRELSSIFQCIFSNFDELPKTENTRIQINTQIRIQKMLSYIREHYAEAVTLEEIARSANISRSEAGRCFNAYVGCSPVDALIQHRLQVAHRLIKDTTRSLQEISYSCGFNSVHYFSRQFRKTYGYTPGHNIVLWVNSAFIWVFCAFVLIGYDDIMQSDYNITFILKEQL